MNFNICLYTELAFANIECKKLRLDYALPPKKQPSKQYLSRLSY